MVYFEDNEVLIRDMIQSDAPIITNEEIAQGWHQTIEKYEMRLQHQAQGKSFALIAEYKGNVAGYCRFDGWSSNLRRSRRGLQRRYLGYARQIGVRSY